MKVFNYILKYKRLTVAIIVLMIIQTSLSYIFPYFNAKIIDVGIQQCGIESCIPEEMSTSTYEQINSLLENKNILGSAYTFNNEKNNYVLKQESSINKSELENTIGTPLAYINTNPEQEQSYIDFINKNTQKMIDQIAISACKDELLKNNVDVNSIQINYMMYIGTLIIILSILILIFTYFANIMISKLTLKIGQNKRQELFESIMSFSNQEIIKFSESSLITRCTNDIQIVQNFASMTLCIIVLAPINIIIGVILSLKTAPMFWWILILLAVGILTSSLILIKICSPIFSSIQNKIDNINLIAREKLSGIFISRAYNNAKIDYIKFKKTNKPLFKSQLLIGKIMAFINPTINFGLACVSILIVILGGYNINYGLLQVGDMYAFSNYAAMITGAFTSVGMFIGSLPRASISVNRIEEVINLKKLNNEIYNKKHIKTDDFNNFTISFNNVYYSYTENSNYAINNINFSINQGESIGIVGGTGSGKTTIVNLLLRLQHTSKGEILLNDTNINDYNLYDYRNLFSFAPQQSFLFSGDLAENITFSTENENISDEKLLELIKIVKADDFILDKSENGLHKTLYQDSINISGGQKQRISLARALAKDTPILVFDDCFNSIDYQTENKIWKQINNYAKNKTKIYISSRISSIKNCDKILVMDEGNIVGCGKYNHLINNCEEFIKIVKSQTSIIDEDKIISE